MAKSVTELLSTQTEQQGEMLDQMGDTNIAPYGKAAQPESEDIGLSMEAADSISGGFQEATSGIINSIEQQNKTLERQQQQLSSILEVLSDQFAYQRAKDLHVEPEVQTFGDPNRKSFDAPEAMKKSDPLFGEGGLLGGLLGALGGGALLKSLLGGGGAGAGGKGDKKPKPKPGGIKNKLGSLVNKFKPGTLAAAGGAAAAGTAAMAGDKNDKDKKKDPAKNKGKPSKVPAAKGGAGILSRLKDFAKGGGTKSKLLMAALAGTAGFIGLDWFSDRQNEIRESLYGLETDKPEEQAGTISSLGILGAAGAGVASVAALVSKFDVGAIRDEAAIHAADAKKNITKSAGDVVKAKDLAKEGIKTTQGSFSQFVSDSTARLRETISSITSKISEKFSALKEKFFSTESKIQKVSETIKAKEAALKEKTTIKEKTTTVKEAAKTGIPKPNAKPGVLSKATGAVGKGLGKALPGVGLAMEAYDLSGTLMDDNVSEGDKAKAVAKSAGGMAGAAGGAALGAAAGSVIPVVGTAIGGIVGGIAGYFGGSEITELVTENLREAVTEAGFGDAIGRAVAVPMSLFSDDARNALKSDMENNIVPKVDEYKKSAVDFFTPSDETKEKLKAGAETVTATAMTVASSANDIVNKSLDVSKETLNQASTNISKMAAPAAVGSTTIVNKTNTVNKAPKTVIASGDDFFSNTTQARNISNSKTNIATPVVAGTTALVAGSAMSSFETTNNKREDFGDDFFSTTNNVAMPSSTVKPEVRSPATNINKRSVAMNSKSALNKTSNMNTEQTNNASTVNNVAQGTVPVLSRAAQQKFDSAPSKQTIHINQGSITHNNNTVQNFAKTPAPEKVSRGQYEHVSKVMMLEENKGKKERKSFPKPEHMVNPAASMGSYKPKAEDIPTIVSDYGLMFINNGFI